MHKSGQPGRALTGSAALKVNLCVILAATGAIAQDSQKPVAPDLELAGALQTDAVGNFNSPANGFNQDLGFLNHSNQFRVTEGTLSVAGYCRDVGFRLDVGGGDFYRVAMATDSWKGPNTYISQAYFIWKPNTRIQIDAGKFFSSVGAEAPHSYDNFNISHSLLFWYAEPLYHVGVRASASIGAGFKAGVQLLSGSNTITGSHGHQTVALTASWSGTRWGWSEIYMDGNEKLEGSGRRHLSDTVITFNPSQAITGYTEVLGVIERRVSHGYDHWYGWATSWKFSPCQKWSFSPRVDWLDDVDGATTGQPQRLFEFTLTGEYHLRQFVIARLEYRSDISNRMFYERAANLRASRQQDMVIASLVFTVHRKFKRKERKPGT